MNQIGDSRLQADHARLAALEQRRVEMERHNEQLQAVLTKQVEQIATLTNKERREFAWAEEYMAKSRSLEMALEAAQAHVATLTEALNEVVTNGEWNGADWSVSTDVYEMASAALAAVREEQK